MNCYQKSKLAALSHANSAPTQSKGSDLVSNTGFLYKLITNVLRIVWITRENLTVLMRPGMLVYPLQNHLETQICYSAVHGYDASLTELLGSVRVRCFHVLYFYWDADQETHSR